MYFALQSVSQAQPVGHLVILHKSGVMLSIKIHTIFCWMQMVDKSTFSTVILSWSPAHSLNGSRSLASSKGFLSKHFLASKFFLQNRQVCDMRLFCKSKRDINC